jgi:energy-coupling factor transporter ATP-binding protein EcfA2
MPIWGMVLSALAEIRVGKVRVALSAFCVMCLVAAVTLVVALASLSQQAAQKYFEEQGGRPGTFEMNLFNGGDQNGPKPLADETITRVGLGERLHSKANQLSGGEQQRVAIARALIRNPRLILADEPTGALDPVTAGQVMDLLFETAAEDGRALILVTHDHVLARRADAVYVLDEGRLSPG